MYATIADLRAEGVTTTAASDSRLTALIDEASRSIDRVTGLFFEPRTMTIRMDGRGTPSVEPYVSPIRIDHLYVDDAEVSHDPADLLVIGGPFTSRIEAPRLTLRRRFTYPWWSPWRMILDRQFHAFRRGDGNVVADGVWGVTEDDGTPLGRTPLAIRRACMMIVMKWTDPLSSDSAYEARNRWRINQEQTRDQRYQLEPIGSEVRQLTGDPEIDALLLPYVRAMPMGAV